jgi:Ca2+-binding RTX toxin-like protein
VFHAVNLQRSCGALIADALAASRELAHETLAYPRDTGPAPAGVTDSDFADDDTIRNDSISGSHGNDPPFGWLGSDTIAGGDGDERLDGGSGDDVPMGRAGDDFITTGLGRDRINVRPGEGFDRVAATDSLRLSTPVAADFDPGLDVIVFDGFGFASRAEALAAFGTTSNGALFSAQGTSILLWGINVDTLSASNVVVSGPAGLPPPLEDSAPELLPPPPHEPSGFDLP